MTAAAAQVGDASIGIATRKWTMIAGGLGPDRDTRRDGGRHPVSATHARLTRIRLEGRRLHAHHPSSVSCTLAPYDHCDLGALASYPDKNVPIVVNRGTGKKVRAKGWRNVHRTGTQAMTSALAGLGQALAGCSCTDAR